MRFWNLTSETVTLLRLAPARTSDFGPDLTKGDSDGAVDHDERLAIKKVQITYPGGSVGNLYTTGAQTNIHEFHQFVTQGQFANPTVAPSVRSNLTAILGRDAALRHTELSWAELLKKGEKLEPDLRGLKA